MTRLRGEIALGLVALADDLRRIAQRLLRAAYWLSGAREETH